MLVFSIVFLGIVGLAASFFFLKRLVIEKFNLGTFFKLFFYYYLLLLTACWIINFSKFSFPNNIYGSVLAFFVYPLLLPPLSFHAYLNTNIHEFKLYYGIFLPIIIQGISSIFLNLKYLKVNLKQSIKIWLAYLLAYLSITVFVGSLWLYLLSFST